MNRPIYKITLLFAVVLFTASCKKEIPNDKLNVEIVYLEKGTSDTLNNVKFDLYEYKSDSSNVFLRSYYSNNSSSIKFEMPGGNDGRTYLYEGIVEGYFPESLKGSFKNSSSGTGSFGSTRYLYPFSFLNLTIENTSGFNKADTIEVVMPAPVQVQEKLYEYNIFQFPVDAEKHKIKIKVLAQDSLNLIYWRFKALKENFQNTNHEINLGYIAKGDSVSEVIEY